MNPFFIFGLAALLVAATASKAKAKAAKKKSCLYTAAYESAAATTAVNHPSWIAWADDLAQFYAGSNAAVSKMYADTAACLRAKRGGMCLDLMARSTMHDWQHYDAEQLVELAAEMDADGRAQAAACIRDKSKW